MFKFCFFLKNPQTLDTISQLLRKNATQGRARGLVQDGQRCPETQEESVNTSVLVS